MIKRQKSLGHRIGIKLLGISLILAGIILLVDIRVRPIIEKTTSYESKILATRIINDAVCEQLSREETDYSSLITISYNENNSISSIESNMVSINRIKADITKSVNDSLSELDENDLNISLGTVSGFQMFYNQGPLIPVKVEPEGYVETELISSFESAGINQTLHRILIEIKVDISAIIPGYTSSAQIDTCFVVAETVIVGNVPNTYTHVITGNEDLISRINDYGAEG